MAPLVSLQKKVYVSILRKELPKLLAFASGASNTPSLRNIVRKFFCAINPSVQYPFHYATFISQVEIFPAL